MDNIHYTKISKNKSSVYNHLTLQQQQESTLDIPSPNPSSNPNPNSSSESKYRSRSTSTTTKRSNGPEIVSHNINNNNNSSSIPIISSTSSISPPVTASSSIYSPPNPRRRVSLSISSTSSSSARNGQIGNYNNSLPYSSIYIHSPPTPRRSRTMSYTRIPSSSRNGQHDNRSITTSSSGKTKSSKTRKIVITLLILLSLILVGTVIVLSSVSYYLGIPNWAYLNENEVQWIPNDIIKPLKDPLEFNLNGHINSTEVRKLRTQRRKEWRDVTDESEVIEPLEASGVLGTETLPESWKELEEEMEELDAEEESDELPAYDDSLEGEAEGAGEEITNAAALEEGDIDGNQNNDDIWGIDGKGSGGYWMQKDWNGKVQDTKSWDRLFNVTTRPGENIPRLIHQTWKSDVLPEKWRKAWKECREGMPDYEYMLWTDDISREFIATHYPAHLHMFDSYEYPIQRADSIRYFILHHFGGVYMDLDIGCRRKLDPLLQGDWEVILPITKPVGVSNDLIFSSKGSAFMDDTVHGLSTFNHQYFTNYPTVMFSTGPMFLSAQYALYSSAHPLTETHPRAEVRILPKSLYGKNVPMSTVPHSFFAHFYGSSWHSDDAGFITFLGAWGKKLMWVGLVVILLGVIRLIWIKRKGGNGNGNQQYQALSILPTSASSNGNSGHRSGSSTPTSVTSSGGLMSPSTTFDLGNLQNQLPSEIASVFKRAGHLILAAPATLLYGHGDRRARRRTGLLYFVPTLFQPDQVRRRGRTASEASQLPLRRPSRRDRNSNAPPPYEPSSNNEAYPMSTTPAGKIKRDEAMDEVDAFLNEADTEGESSTFADGETEPEVEAEGDGDWDDWRRKSDNAN